MPMCISGSLNLTPLISVPNKIAKADLLLFVPPEKHCQEILFWFIWPIIQVGLMASWTKVRERYPSYLSPLGPTKTADVFTHLTMSSLLVFTVLGTFLKSFLNWRNYIDTMCKVPIFKPSVLSRSFHWLHKKTQTRAVQVLNSEYPCPTLVFSSP